MIKISFPFSNYFFIVDSPTNIESHFFEKFLLFAEFIKAYDNGSQRSIVIRVIEYDINHASFVKMFDKGILLLGKSGAGKSTLSAYLHLMAGCECYTDDIALMNYNTKITQGVSQYINLRSSSLDLLPMNHSEVYDSFIERYKIILNNRAGEKVDYIVSLNLHIIF